MVQQLLRCIRDATQQFSGPVGSIITRHPFAQKSTAILLASPPTLAEHLKRVLFHSSQKIGVTFWHLATNQKGNNPGQASLWFL